jgi:general secretion pathway protein F
MSAGDVVRQFWWVIAVAIIALVFWLRWNLKKPDFRLRFDTALLRIPLFGRLILGIEVERFFRTLGTLVANGVSLPTALSITKDTLSNSVIVNAVRDSALKLREGKGLADQLAQTKVFPRTALDLIRIGEESGKLDKMLLRQADLDAQRLKHTIDRLLSLLVPGLTIVLGLVVAALIASMLVAILGVNDLALQ